MSRDEYGLVQLRTEMMQGKRDALQGMSLLNKADEYWIPLQQVLHLLHTWLQLLRYLRKSER